jgi:sigma-B regulation protein RsbU (phosphoserine phosphatase)
MGKDVNVFANGIAGKMLRYVVVFVLAMGLSFMVIFGIHLSGLHNMIRLNEKQQLELVSGRSSESMTNITVSNLKSVIVAATERADDEFRIVKEDLLALRSQVEDVFRHPDSYLPRQISPPRKEDGTKPVLQLLAPGAYSDISPETYLMMQRLANLEPMMREIVLAEDYVVDSYISTLDGVTLSFDRLSESKFDDEGNLKTYDASERNWFKGALETKDVYFSATVKSALYGFHEVVYSVPVYVDDRPVAVLEGCLHMEAMTEYMNGREIGESGFSILISKEGQLSSSPRESGELKQGDDTSADIRTSVNPELKTIIDKGLSGETGVTKLTVDGEAYYAAYGYIPISGWAQVIFVSVDDVMKPANNLIHSMEEYSDNMISRENRAFNLSMISLVVVIIFSMIVSIFRVGKRIRKRVAPILKMNNELHEFSGVNMFFEVEDEYRTGDEIQVLAENFEALAGKMRDYIDAIIDEMSEKERVRTELSMATRIQEDMLPNIFPAFPDRTEFNIYASMTPAKEVGGDFYDFFFAGEDHLAMVMADVSGKGVPAAMFMMMAKSMIQSQMIAKGDPGTVLYDVNNLICANNREKMFVTVWLGVLDINTGVMVAANAGHEYPILKDPDGDFTVIKDKHGFVIGGKKNMKYTNYEMVMKPGSKLFVYTDGVPEATDDKGNLFGMERTLEAVNMAAGSSAEVILSKVDSEVRKFVGGAEQFDDLTMMCVEYKGARPPAKEITVEAKVESLEAVMAFVDGELESLDCPALAKGQINVAVDEIFGNIAHYAYGEGTGEATISLEVSPDKSEVSITFTDSGLPFNPLEAKKPDVTLKAKERKKGGLGIYLVKKTMNDVTYEFKEGKNNLTIRKVLEGSKNA